MKISSDSKKNGIVFALVFMVLPVSGIAETGKTPDAAAAKRGAVIYQKHCASCHGLNAEGQAAPPPMLRNPGYVTAPALNGSAHAWHHKDEDLLKVIMEGSKRPNTMPGWKGVLTIKQAKDVIAYFKNLWPKRLLDCQGPKHMSCM